VVNDSIERFNGLSTWEAAFAYEAAGLKIIPLAGVSIYPEGLQCSCFLGKRCPSPGKHAKVPWGPVSAFQTEPFTWHTVAQWFHPEFGYWPTANIGLPTGVNDLAVLDVDGKSGGFDSLMKLESETGLTLTETFVQETGSGGLHLVFAAPPGGIKSDSVSFGDEYPGLDTRGRGGLIVVAPSRHVSGGRYSFARVVEPLAWPEALTALMVRTGGDLLEAEPIVTIPAFVRGLATSRREAIYQMEEAEEGSRNALLNRIAYRVAMDGGTDNEFDLLRRVAEDSGLDPVEVVKTIDSGRSAALRGALQED
jgi:bifunctional DNA primase/polymerase-like protein